MSLKLSFDYISDIHLEFRHKVFTLIDLQKEVKIEPSKEKTLILAGDIGYPYQDRFWTFLESCCNVYDKVFCIASNHEYYCLDACANMVTIDQINEIIKTNRVKYENLHYLINESIIFDNIKVIGSTKWTSVPKNYIGLIKNAMNDYQQIYSTKHSNISVNDTNEFNKISREFIIKEIENSEKDVIVITHHLPSRKLISPKHDPSSYVSYGYFSSMEDVVTDKVKLWFAGHTHTKCVKVLNNAFNCKCYVNPLGYPKENYNSIMENVTLSDQTDTQPNSTTNG